MVYFVFWCHFIVGLMAHIFVPLMVAFGILLVSSWGLGFIGSGAAIGVIFCCMVWGVNHVTNPDSYCWLTDLEQIYREQKGMKPCRKAFTPRFYTKCRQILKGDFKSIPE